MEMPSMKMEVVVRRRRVRIQPHYLGGLGDGSVHTTTDAAQSPRRHSHMIRHRSDVISSIVSEGEDVLVAQEHRPINADRRWGGYFKGSSSNSGDEPVIGSKSMHHPVDLNGTESWQILPAIVLSIVLLSALFLHLASDSSNNKPHHHQSKSKGNGRSSKQITYFEQRNFGAASPKKTRSKKKTDEWSDDEFASGDKSHCLSHSIPHAASADTHDSDTISIPVHTRRSSFQHEYSPNPGGFQNHRHRKLVTASIPGVTAATTSASTTLATVTSSTNQTPIYSRPVVKMSCVDELSGIEGFRIDDSHSPLPQLSHPAPQQQSAITMQSSLASCFEPPSMTTYATPEKSYKVDTLLYSPQHSPLCGIIKSETPRRHSKLSLSPGTDDDFISPGKASMHFRLSSVDANGCTPRVENLRPTLHVPQINTKPERTKTPPPPHRYFEPPPVMSETAAAIITATTTTLGTSDIFHFASPPFPGKSVALPSKSDLPQVPFLPALEALGQKPYEPNVRPKSIDLDELQAMMESGNISHWEARVAEESWKLQNHVFADALETKKELPEHVDNDLNYLIERSDSTNPNDDVRKSIQHKRTDLTISTDSAASLQVAINFAELRLVELIGCGGFGQVWKAIWRGTPVAVKVLTGSAQSKNVPKAVLEEFDAEINLLRGMRHPNVCLYMGACLFPPHRAIITELAANGSLWDALRLPLMPPYGPCDGVSREFWPLNEYSPDSLPAEHPSVPLVPPSCWLPYPIPPRGSWPWDLVKRVACGAARGMAYLHSGKPPVLHRDLKSANILLDESYTAKVCDFGLSRLKSQGRSMTANVGTVQWMAPEVLANLGYNEKADIYSFGIICWEMLARQCPFDGMTAIQCAIAVLNRDERPEIPKWCPPSLHALILSCISINPTERPTFVQIIQALDSMP